MKPRTSGNLVVKSNLDAVELHLLEWAIKLFLYIVCNHEITQVIQFFEASV